MKEKETVNIPWKELVKPGVIVYSVLYLLLTSLNVITL